MAQDSVFVVSFAREAVTARPVAAVEFETLLFSNEKTVGILSFGSDQCGAPGVPSVYTNIKKYITWIRENTPQVYGN
ncbi:hypothetical protein NQ318_012990 [Aromia moschata]|uniref:Peptidase S1 domain-containing protein n=1 Tax=Aromia moschata TaxID=1265417 RepID=A0AAV8Y299_9CUCU|nr:hypothetical protein NQ318_012990 [Aromia moschata]